MIRCCNSLHILHFKVSLIRALIFLFLPFFRNIWILDDYPPPWQIPHAALFESTCSVFFVNMVPWNCAPTAPPPPVTVGALHLQLSIYPPSYVLRSEDAGLIDSVSQMCKCVNITYDQTHWPTVFLMITEDSRLQPSCVHCVLRATLSGWTISLQPQ